MSKGIKKYFLPLLLIFILSACNLPVAAEGLQSGESGEDAGLLLTITAQALILEGVGQDAAPIGLCAGATVALLGNVLCRQRTLQFGGSQGRVDARQQLRYGFVVLIDAAAQVADGVFG